MVDLNLPKQLSASFSVITPMFIGDAQQQANSVYPQSVKGALRFWWRALMWPQLRSQYTDDTATLRALHQAERQLFGGDAEHKAPAAIAIRVSDKPYKILEKDSIHSRLKSMTGARYLGYGVVEAFASRKKNIEAGQLIRSCLEPQQTFTVTIISQSQKAIPESLISALKLFGMLGGLGAKTRKGYGSVQLNTLTRQKLDIKQEELLWQMPDTEDKLRNELAQILAPTAQCPDKDPPFSSFSPRSIIMKVVEGKDAYGVLNAYGCEMVRYRSWGHRKPNSDRHTILENEDSEQNFPEDHDWSKDGDEFKKNYPQLNFNTFHPRRVVFGLPHSYGKNVDVCRMPQNKNTDKKNKDPFGRRASPLFFHIAQLNEQQYIGIATLLRAQFLPADESINAKGKAVPQHIDWRVIKEGFLQDEQRFPKKITLFSGQQGA